jgi:hypothetical protein
MQESNLIIIALFFLIILLGACFWLGYYFGQKKSVAPQTCPSSLLDLKLINSWIAFAMGEVKEISNQDFILSSSGETLKISISEKTRIQKLNPTTQLTEKADFNDIKVGSKLNTQLVFMPKEKLLIGDLIVILP